MVICGRCQKLISQGPTGPMEFGRCETCKKLPKTQQERLMDAIRMGVMSVGPASPRSRTYIWSDVCKRRCACQGCPDQILKGQKRIVFDVSAVNGMSPRKGGTATRLRQFIHIDCFISAISYDCAGCTDQEFERVTEMLRSTYGPQTD